eukprot:scaffold18326_cov79-Skeletonema_marinoi.AAC.3
MAMSDERASGSQWPMVVNKYCEMGTAIYYYFRSGAKWFVMDALMPIRGESSKRGAIANVRSVENRCQQQTKDVINKG